MFLLLSSLVGNLVEVMFVMFLGQIAILLSREKDRWVRAWKVSIHEAARELEKTLSKLILPSFAISIFVVLLLKAPLLYRSLHIDTAVSQHSVQFVSSFVVLLCGGLACWAKKLYQLPYGLAELVFGVATAYSNVNGLGARDAVFEKWTPLIGAVYVVSRGVSNVVEARARLGLEQDRLTKEAVSRFVTWRP